MLKSHIRKIGAISLCIIAGLLLSISRYVHASEQNSLENTPASALVIPINGAISPASADFILRGIKQANRDNNNNTKLIIIQLDTPGGLDKAMRHIIKGILMSTKPIVTFVAPSGARAASAGTYILVASPIAAMAPGTNIGAATPVSIGSVPEPDKTDPKTAAKEEKKKQESATNKKARNDATAYIVSLAQMRGRNTDWVKKAVEDAASIPAQKALSMGVIDLIANDIPDLLTKLDGRTVSMLNQQVKLQTKHLAIKTLKADWRVKFLEAVTDPSVAYILLLIGIYGLFFEFLNPGFVLPGVAGAICLLVALYAFHMLPISYVGLALILLGIIFMIAEAFVPSFGALGFGGVVSFIVGSVLLMDTQTPGYGLPWSVIITMAVINTGFIFFVISLALKARNRPIVAGEEAMPGYTGHIVSGPNNNLFVMVNGELWRYECKEDLIIGDKVKIQSIDGLTLIITKDDQQK